MTTMNSNSNLFSVEGIVAVITGGGSGMLIFSEEADLTHFSLNIFVIYSIFIPTEH